MNERPFVTALVLAAGSSKRLGQPKQLLPYGKTTLLGAVLERAEESEDLDEVLLVLGNAAEAVRASVTLHRARAVYNPEFGEGCAASYRTGLASTDSRAGAVMILLGDQPGLSAEAIHQVAESWRQEGGKIVLASYLGRRGHPLIFDRQLFPELEQLHGDKAAWKLTDQHPDWVREVELGQPMPADVDTRADYEALAQPMADSQASP